MKKENVFKTIFVSVFFPALYLCIMLFVSFVFGFVYFIAHIRDAAGNTGVFARDLSDCLISDQIYILLGTIVIFLSVTLIIFKARRVNFLKRVRWNPAPMPVYAMAALLAVAQGFASNLVNYALPQSWIDAYDTYVSEPLIAHGFVLALAVAAFLGPVTEEIAFRGLMLTRLQGRMANGFVVALSALAFTAAHAGGSVAQAIGVLPLAVIICVVFIWTDSIRVTILIHIVNNAVSLIASQMPPLSESTAGGATVPGLIVSFIGLGVTVVLLYFIYARTRTKPFVIHS